MNQVKDIEAWRDQGMEEIEKLQKSLFEAMNKVTILKKTLGKGSIGGASNIKIKEIDSYDGVRSTKFLETFYGT